MASITFFCANEGYEDNWIEVEKKWTGADSSAAESATLWTEIIPILHKKVSACNLMRDDGSVMTDITELTFEKRHEFDPVIQGFISGILQQTVMRLRALGNANVQVSSSAKGGRN